MEKFEKHFLTSGNNGFATVFEAAAANGEWNSKKRGGAWKILTSNGEIESLNLTLVHEIDATDVFDLTKAEIEGRRQIIHIIELFRKYGKDIGLGGIAGWDTSAVSGDILVIKYKNASSYGSGDNDQKTE